MFITNIQHATVIITLKSLLDKGYVSSFNIIFDINIDQTLRLRAVPPAMRESKMANSEGEMAPSSGTAEEKRQTISKSDTGSFHRQAPNYCKQLSVSQSLCH